MQPLMLLSGLLCDETVWWDIPSRLADVARVQVLSFGGLSSIGAMADYVLQRAPPRFAVAGHSMGGRVALELWRREPARVTALALLNTGVHPTRDAEHESRGVLLRIAQTKGMAALADDWLPPMMGASTERIHEVMPALRAMVVRSTPESFAAQIQALLQRPDARPMLASITVRTLLLSGTNDTWSSLAQHADMQRRIPDSLLVEIAGAGHMAPAERPEAVARALRGWLSSAGGIGANRSVESAPDRQRSSS